MAKSVQDAVALVQRIFREEYGKGIKMTENNSALQQEIRAAPAPEFGAILGELQMLRTKLENKDVEELPDHLVASQATKILHICEDTVHFWVRSGKLPSVRSGRRIGIPKAASIS